MGSGDWNDGLNSVGRAGRGVRVWLGLFLHRVLLEFRTVARLRGDDTFAERCERHARKLAENLEKHGWDGAWYRRAYFDDGTPLGSSQNTECRIDSIAQSWSVLSGAGTPEHTEQALDSLDKHLVDADAGLIKLLQPPFDKADPDPGYIRGYVPGVRENGGQYTHAAIWAIMAFAQAGRVERAWELFGMINPLRHADTAAGAQVYKVEPYVAAADVLAVAPHTGRGGWTWYTGSAGWMYRLIIESLIGLRREGARLRIEPRVPAAWPGLKVTYRFGEAVYEIEIVRDGAVASPQVALDGEVQSDLSIALVDDGAAHRVEVRIGKGGPRVS
jgi:cellobiose phosphorylase